MLLNMVLRSTLATLLQSRPRSRLRLERRRLGKPSRNEKPAAAVAKRRYIMPSEPEWKMPPLKIGQRVYVGKHPDQLLSESRVIGLITDIHTDTVDITTFAPRSDRSRAWEAARHIDDPALTNLADLMREDYFAVFMDAEKDFQGNGFVPEVSPDRRQYAQEIEILSKRVDFLETKVANLPKRGPGRPKKQLPEAEEMNV